MSKCHCGNDLPFKQCCQPIIAGQPAPTAEALMRARYSAYVVGDIDFLTTSLAPEERHDFEPEQAKAWSENSKWIGLTIHAVKGGGPDDQVGLVDFTASYEYQGARQDHRELASFKRIDGVWHYTDGRMRTHDPITRGPKTGRNDPCPCGSGKKFKKCCGKAQ
ncbi:SEC-C motif-containing protein [Humidesulfovibrio mexicanus]|uniref:SEC-C motif-containing protein n=1 Tax=Humidesulfovibrio mexicanus TaxID=147047 RepID=A0A239AAJ4_9BACT|nr:YchJ family metal-binding protein [Humidesulfovibrio mexicanus]SNR92422.1 SEC-C motif-containing protein [Humidesulfovibrio mexicanus]